MAIAHLIHQPLAVFALLIPATQAVAAPYSWQEPQAQVLPDGDLKWTPRPLAFKPGTSIRSAAGALVRR
jgi:hypothetical protein